MSGHEAARSRMVAARRLLAEARYQRGWSQQELADRLGTTQLNVSRWERCLTTPGPYFRQHLSTVFGLDEVQLGLRLPDLSPAATPADVSPTAASPQTPLLDPALPLPSTPLLVGREQVRAHVLAQLQHSSLVALSALQGLPGIGKTALALEMAYDPAIRQHYPDGVLWAGLGPAPNVLSILSRWGALLGIKQDEASRLESVAAWARTLRATIAERRLLFLLDDAWELDAALACRVGGPGCGYLLTTRLPLLALSFAPQDHVVMETLDEAESLHLLSLLAPRVVEQEPEQVQQLIKQVGGLPLALTLVGNYLRLQAHNQQPRRVRAALQQMQEHLARLHVQQPVGPLEPVAASGAGAASLLSLQTVIASSDEQLSQQGQLMLRALGVLPARPESFSEEAALAVSAGTLSTLDELCDAGLLESAGEARYSLHQTIADYARAHQRETVPWQRLIDYSLSYARAHQQDLPELQAERGLLHAALRVCEQPEQEAWLVGLVLLLAPGWLAQGEGQLAAQYLPLALAAAQRSGQRQEEMRLWQAQGNLARQQGAYEQAIAAYEQAQQLAKQSEDGAQHVAALIGLSWTLTKQGQYERAEELTLQGLTLLDEQQHQELPPQASQGVEGTLPAEQAEGMPEHLRQRAHLLRLLGSVAILQGRIPQAVAYGEAGLQVARQVEDHELVCMLLSNLAEALNKLEGEQSSQAAQYRREGLELARQQGYRYWECFLLATTGSHASTLGQYAFAEEALHHALQMARQMAAAEWECSILSDLGFLHINQGAYAQAQVVVRESLSLTRQIGYRQYEYACLYYLGRVAMEQGRYAEAEDLEQQALQLATQIGLQDARGNTLASLGWIALWQGDYQRAEDRWQESLQVARDLDLPWLIGQAFIGLAAVAMKQGSDERAEAYVQQEQQLSRAHPGINADLSEDFLPLRAELFLQQGQLEQAAAVFEHLRESSPATQRKAQAQALYGLARVAWARGEQAEARRLGKQSLALFSSMPHVLTHEVEQWLREREEDDPE